jgi:hypothetical protein
VTPISPAPTAISEQDLLEKYGEKLASMIRTGLEQDMEAERLTQVMMALSFIEMRRGNQYTAPKLDKTTGDITLESARDNEGRDMFTSVYNIFGSDGDKFIGAVSSRAPNATVVPEDDEDDESVQRAKEAGAHLRDLRVKLRVDDKMGELGENAWVTGPSFGLTTYVSDAHKYGSTEEPVIEQVDVPVGPFGETMPTPQVVGTKRYPKGDVELNIYNILYVTIPYKAKYLCDADYLCLEYLESKAVLKSLFGKKLRDKFGRYIYEDTQSGTKDSTFEAQERAYTPSGSARDDWKKNNWRYSRWWIRPALYSMIEGSISFGGDDENAQSVSLAEQLYEQFPDGLKITLVNGRVVDVAHERIDEVWSVCKVAKGGSIIREPLGAGVAPIQRDVNNFFNMAKEIILRTIVKTAINAQAFDREALKENDAIIYEYVPVETGPGQKIGDLMQAFPTANMPDGLERILQAMLNVRREIGGVTEALFGGGQPANTYRAEKQRRDQSMIQFAPFFDCTRAFWRDVYTNAIKQRARYGSGKIKVPGEDGDGAMVVDMALLAEGGWHIQVDEGIPTTITEETDRAMFMMAESGDPELPAKMGLVRIYPSTFNAGPVAVPDPKFQRMLGIQGIRAAGEIEREKSLEIIKRLLKEPPIVDIDPMTGQEMRRPVIEPDPLIDDPALLGAMIREWCNDKPGRREADRNPEGFAHVLSFLQALKDLEMALAPPLPPEEGGAPSDVPPEEVPVPQEQPVPFDTAPPQI